MIKNLLKLSSYATTGGLSGLYSWTNYQIYQSLHQQNLPVRRSFSLNSYAQQVNRMTYQGASLETDLGPAHFEGKPCEKFCQTLSSYSPTMTFRIDCEGWELGYQSKGPEKKWLFGLAHEFN